MSQDQYQDEKESSSKKNSLRQWQRFLGVTYRLVIIIGLVLLLPLFIAVIVTDIVPPWVLIIPLIMILIGIILARFEYSLYKRNKKE